MSPAAPGPEAPPEYSGQLSRRWLYALALVFIGALVTPIAWRHPGLSRREKLLIIGLGCLQTLAAVVFALLFCAWMAARVRQQLGAGGG